MVNPLISIVIPCLNEEECVEKTYDEICRVISAESAYDFEFMFTDNHSTDRTFDVLKKLAQKDPRVRAIRFSKNFGYQKSIFTGYMKATGDAAVQLDADLQDPPHLISEFLRKWEEGYRVVYGIRKTEKKNHVVALMAEVFYWLLNLISESDLPRNAGECRLIDRIIIDELAKIPDKNMYVRGRIAELGFRQTGIPYTRQTRVAGVTKFDFRSLLRLSVDAISSHSTVPLRLATYLGALILGLTIIGSLGFFLGKLFFGQAWPAGFATIVILILILNGVNLLLLGILGEYIGRIHCQLKAHPDVIVEEEA